METKYMNDDIIEYPLSENKVNNDFFKETITSDFIGRKAINELEI